MSAEYIALKDKVEYFNKAHWRYRNQELRLHNKVGSGTWPEFFLRISKFFEDVKTWDKSCASYASRFGGDDLLTKNRHLMVLDFGLMCLAAAVNSGCVDRFFVDLQKVLSAYQEFESIECESAKDRSIVLIKTIRAYLVNMARAGTEESLNAAKDVIIATEKIFPKSLREQKAGIYEGIADLIGDSNPDGAIEHYEVAVKAYQKLKNDQKSIECKMSVAQLWDEKLKSEKDFTVAKSLARQMIKYIGGIKIPESKTKNITLELQRLENLMRAYDVLKKHSSCDKVRDSSHQQLRQIVIHYDKRSPKDKSGIADIDPGVLEILKEYRQINQLKRSAPSSDSPTGVMALSFGNPAQLKRPRIVPKEVAEP